MTASHPPRATEPRRRLGDHPLAVHVRGAAPWLAPTLLFALSSTLLFNRLDLPPRIIFDETYYVKDALSFLATGGVEDSFAVHPPVGKWIIAGSIRLFGDTALGWRMAGAAAGALMVHLTWLLGLRLTRSRPLAFLAAVMLTLDGLFLVQARTSMLDIHLALFVLLGAWLLVRDLQSLDTASLTRSGLHDRSLRDRWLAGVAFGLAIGTKWSGLLALGTALVLVVGFEVLAHRRTSPRGVGALRLLWVVVGPLLLLPTTTYLASYVPWMAAYEHTTEGKEDCPGAAEGEAECLATVGDRIAGLWREHGDIMTFHRNLESTHTYRAEPWTWPVLGRPVAYYYETCKADRPADDPCEISPGTASEVLALGNPALWWGFALLVPVLAGAMGRRRPSAWVLGGFYSGLFLPWLLVSRPAFLFYMVPAVPFIALSVAWSLGRLQESPRDAVPWLSALGGGGAAALVAVARGATKPGIGIAFGVGWVVTPFVATFLWDRWQARRAEDVEVAELVEAVANDEALATDDEADAPDGLRRDEALAPTISSWWPSRLPLATSTSIPVLVVGTLLVAAVVACAVFFLPVWTGVEMDPEVLRRRWWFSSWI